MIESPITDWFGDPRVAKAIQKVVDNTPHGTYYTYRYDIGTRQHYLNARNKAEALEKFRSDYGPRVRSIHVHRADWAGWHS